MEAIVRSVRTIHRGRVFTLTTEELSLPNGNDTTIDIIRHPGASAVVPVTASGEVILLRQYRHAVSAVIWEIPAGTFDGKEDPLVCAKRELIEETGHAAAMWRKLGEITPVAGYSDERIHLFLATELTPASQHLDPDEVLSIHPVAYPTAIDMIHEGIIQDAKTIAGLFLAGRFLHR
uniref:GDP-mannose pyrophosphatase n=1 Tax=Desulfatirhabdium butyrativorans TaxID=340467 RepID=A0A7C4RUP6_9BACT